MRTETEWTHQSLKSQEIGEDPVGFVKAKARELTFRAIEEGWAGPPFDQLELARVADIETQPKQGIPDARIVPLRGGRFRIEYNPSRPSARVRFSIAHEIAHTFFPDCA